MQKGTFKFRNVMRQEISGEMVDLSQNAAEKGLLKLTHICRSYH